jgi:Icc-related predicted phosphoesterase
MRIAHASDLHGRYEVLDRVNGVAPDLWVLTGDFFPNRTRGNREVEVRWQTNWFGHKSFSIRRRLLGAPVLLVPGNHDYANLASLLRCDGVDAREVTPEGCTFRGVRFAGFGHIPFIAGEWNRESTTGELYDLTQRCFDCDPDVLLTHSPPDGILNGLYPGIGPITTALTYRPHKVTHHLFGHSHEDGGKVIERMGVTFVNSATTLQWVELP